MRMPPALVELLHRLHVTYGHGPVIAEVVGCVEGLREVVAWQLARIEQLEDALAKAGAAAPLKCFACQSGEVQVEHRGRQRRHTCQECGYAWRFGVKETS